MAASVPVLDVAEAQVEADGLGQQGQQCSLLQLVVQDGCVTLAPACSHISLPFFVERGGGGETTPFGVNLMRTQVLILGCTGPFFVETQAQADHT